MIIAVIIIGRLQADPNKCNSLSSAEHRNNLTSYTVSGPFYIPISVCPSVYTSSSALGQTDHVNFPSGLALCRSENPYHAVSEGSAQLALFHRTSLSLSVVR